MSNKAHTATARRIARRYGALLQSNGGIDVKLDSFLVAVETCATLNAGFELLQALSGRRYLAVTNREAVSEAVEKAQGTLIGVMDAQGNIVKEAGMGDNQ